MSDPTAGDLAATARKTYTVSLGGKDRVLRYSQLHGIAIQRRTGRAPRAVAESMGTDQEARLVMLTAGLAPPMKGGRFQIAALMAWIDSNIEEVAGWLDDLVQSGQGLGPVYRQVTYAAYASGMVLGVALDLEAVEREQEREQTVVVAEGKAEQPQQPQT